eukprot:767107-Hanusia_phi.AAC.2
MVEDRYGDPACSILVTRLSAAQSCPSAPAALEGNSSTSYVFQLPIPETCLNLASRPDYTVEVEELALYNILQLTSGG